MLSPGERMVELADDAARFELRDPRTIYTAYVPSGSLRVSSSDL